MQICICEVHCDNVMCLHICVYAWTCLCMCDLIFAGMYICVCAHTYLFTCNFTRSFESSSVCFGVLGYAYICTRMFVSVDVYVCFGLRKCISAWVCACLRGFIWVFSCMHVCKRLNACTCTGLCVYVRVQGCVQVWTVSRTRACVYMHVFLPMSSLSFLQFQSRTGEGRIQEL